MYSASVTARMVDAANAQQRTTLQTLGKPVWELQSHNAAQIDIATVHLDSLWDPEDRKLRRPLTPDEQQFIQNERKLCALDFRGYWLPHYAKIIDWRKQPTAFTPNVAQGIMLDLWADSEGKGHAIWTQILKARQLGMSTLTELAVTHRHQFVPYTNSVVASAAPDKTLQMAAMIKYCLDQQPWWLLPEVTKIKAGIPVEFGKQYCTLAIEAGNQFTGVGRGTTPNVVHLSEVSTWIDAEDLIEAALLPAIHDTPDVFGVLESTAAGAGYWKKKWEASKIDYPAGRSRIRPAFLPWFVGTDLYPTDTEARAMPVPLDWQPADRTVNMAERARQYVLTNPLLLQYLAKGDRDWRLPRLQMWWWECKYEQSRRDKLLHHFLAEFCSDDFEAFQSSNVPIIDTEILLGYQQRTRQPIGVYTIIGPDIPQALTTPRRYWDSSKPPITIRTRDVVPKLDVRYQLIPLTFEGYATFDWELKLLVWEWPDERHSYGVGVDTSEGIGQDRAVIQALREATPAREPGQVAEWASAYVTAFQLWPLVMAVGCLYSTYRPAAARKVQCRLAIECFANGAATQYELQKRGWSNFHPWKSYDNRKPRRDGDVNKLGVFTNHAFRAQMFDMLLTTMSEEAIDLPSPYLVEELRTLENVGSKPQAALGEHDDRVLGLGFPLFSLHMGTPPTRQYARQRVSYVPSDEDHVKPNYPVWQPDAQARDVTRPDQVMRVARRQGFARQVQVDRFINHRMPRGYR